eukprot:946172_1
MSSVLDFEAENVNRKRSKKRRMRRSRNDRDRVGHAHKKTTKSKKRKKNKTKKKLIKGNKNMMMSPLNENKNNKCINKSKEDLPIITEEDNEDGSFSDSYIPTRYDASGFFSYHTWDDQSDTVRPPDEDRIVRTGPSIWHWSWDLSFGLYDDIYDKLNNNYKNNKKWKTKNYKNKELFLEDTWLNLEG